MKVLSIILIIGLIAFTAWQAYLTIKKIILKRKLKQSKSVVTNNSKSNVDVTSTEDNSTKEDKNNECN